MHNTVAHYWRKVWINVVLAYKTMVWRAEAGSVPSLCIGGPKYPISLRHGEHCVTYLFKNWPLRLIVQEIFGQINWIWMNDANRFCGWYFCVNDGKGVNRSTGWRFKDFNKNNKRAVLCHHSGQWSMQHEAKATFGSNFSFFVIVFFLCLWV